MKDLQEFKAAEIEKHLGSLGLEGYLRTDVFIDVDYVEIPFLVKDIDGECGSPEYRFNYEKFLNEATKKTHVPVILHKHKLDGTIEKEKSYCHLGADFYNFLEEQNLLEAIIQDGERGKPDSINEEEYISYLGRLGREGDIPKGTEIYHSNNPEDDYFEYDINYVPEQFVWLNVTVIFDAEYILMYLAYQNYKGNLGDYARYSFIENQWTLDVLMNYPTLNHIFEDVNNVLTSSTKGQKVSHVNVYWETQEDDAPINSVDELRKTILVVYNKLEQDALTFISSDTERVKNILTRTATWFERYTDQVYKAIPLRTKKLSLSVNHDGNTVAKLPIKAVLLEIGNGNVALLVMTPISAYVINKAFKPALLYNLHTMALEDCHAAVKSFGLGEYIKVCDLRSKRTLAELISNK